MTKLADVLIVVFKVPVWWRCYYQVDGGVCYPGDFASIALMKLVSSSIVGRRPLLGSQANVLGEGVVKRASDVLSFGAPS